MTLPPPPLAQEAGGAPGADAGADAGAELCTVHLLQVPPKRRVIIVGFSTNITTAGTPEPGGREEKLVKW